MRNDVKSNSINVDQHDCCRAFPAISQLNSDVLRIQL